jgi:UDP-glucose 4-epimerase
MQLITAGKGFIGMNTARALLELGEASVLTTRHAERNLPAFLRAEVGKRIFIEALDLSDQRAFLEIGKRHKITGIIHLAGAVLGRGSFMETFEETKSTLQGQMNVLVAAREWSVSRVSVASTIGVYAGAGEGPFREDMLLPMTPTHPLPMSKKIMELLGGIMGFNSGMEIVNLRIGGAWGPLFHHLLSPWNIPGHLVRSAVNNVRFDEASAYAEGGADSCYVKDLGRAIALIQVAPKLNHSTYNIGTGQVMKNRDLVAAIKKIIPSAELELRDGFGPQGQGRFSMDTTRLREEVGFEAAFDIERGVADYIDWLRRGNEY